MHPQLYSGTNLRPEYDANTMLHSEYGMDVKLCLVNQEPSAGAQLLLRLVSAMLVVDPRSGSAASQVLRLLPASGLNKTRHNALILFSH